MRNTTKPTSKCSQTRKITKITKCNIKVLHQRNLVSKFRNVYVLNEVEEHFLKCYFNDYIG